FDHHDGDTSRYLIDESEDIPTLLDRETREGLVEKEYPGILRGGHGDLGAAALSVRRLRERAIGEMLEAHPRQGGPRLGHEPDASGEPHERVPAKAGQAEQRQGDVSQERLARERSEERRVGKGGRARVLRGDVKERAS